MDAKVVSDFSLTCWKYVYRSQFCSSCISVPTDTNVTICILCWSSTDKHINNYFLFRNSVNIRSWVIKIVAKFITICFWIQLYVCIYADQSTHGVCWSILDTFDTFKLYFKRWGLNCPVIYFWGVRYSSPRILLKEGNYFLVWY